MPTVYSEIRVTLANLFMSTMTPTAFDSPTAPNPAKVAASYTSNQTQLVILHDRENEVMPT